MKVILKYTFHNKLTGHLAVGMPPGAKPLHVEMQDGTARLWVEVPQERSLKVDLREFQIFGTGEPIPNEAIYVGTFLQNDGQFVWHVYEVIP